MNFVWWGIWLVMIIWIFALPYGFQGQRNRKDKPLEIFRKRFASGKINAKEYEEMKMNLEKR
jgi:putative membrane protein